jgi:membrane-associated phospholipid phosphatase
MPRDITIFGAQYLIYLDALLAAVVVVLALYRKPRTAALRWAVIIVLTAVIAFIGAQIGAAVFNDPRPFTQDHVKPLIAHGPDNGFPSDHGLLAALVVAAVLLLDLRFVAVFVVLGVLVDWARVGAGIHHVIDVVGSAAFVALGLAIGYALGPAIMRLLLPHLPERFLGDDRQSAGKADLTG